MVSQEFKDFLPFITLLLGVLLGAAPPWIQKRWRRASYWGALRIELDVCRDLARIYLNAKVAAPLYRLPTKSYDTALPALLADAGITRTEFQALGTFFNEVLTLNRGLDAVAAAVRAKDEDFVTGEFARNTIKAKHLVNDYFPVADEVVRRHITTIG